MASCRLLASLLALAPLRCAGQSAVVGRPLTDSPLVDKNATQATQDLFANLLNVMLQQVGPSGNGGITATMFGHQDDLAYGYNWPYVENAPIANPPDSDVFFATGNRTYPKIFGFDIGNIYQPDGKNVDGLYKGDIARWVRKAYSMGGIITMTMHNNNPMTGASPWDNRNGTVASILPGGKDHSKWMGILASLGDFIESLAPIPILFRPYHEANHKWSWWGFSACTREEYAQLWKMTVDYWLQRPTWGHNVLFVISPQDPSVIGSGKLNDPSEYFARYPGDDYVDVLGFDGYELWSYPGADTTGKTLASVIEYSRDHMQKAGYLKPVALTEAGQMYAYVPHGETETMYGPPNWWTKCLDKALSLTSYRLAWVLVWRNPTKPDTRCFVPAVKPSGGDICELADFLTFMQQTVVAAKKVQFLEYSRTLNGPPLVDKRATQAVQDLASIQGSEVPDLGDT